MNMFKYFIVTCFLYTISLSILFAAYPDKTAYPDDWINGIYIGANVGPSMSNTFNEASNKDFIALYTPTNMLSSSFSSIVLGANVWMLRAEVEYLYLYNWTDILNDSTLHTPDANSATSWFPSKGQEVLKNAFAANVYYDMKFISHSFYPYIGFGGGIGKQEYLMVDLSMQPNGWGEEYEGSDYVPFGQFMLGLKYDTKIIKSSFTLEYRLTSVSAVNINPLNPGNDRMPDSDDCTGDVCPAPPPDFPTTSPQSVKSVYHSIIFGFKYYLY